MHDRAKPTRQWFQFRLRTLLIVVPLLALPLSWFAMRMEKARSQREAVKAIAKLGGGVRYDYHDGPCDPAVHPPIPSILLTLLGDDFFSDVVGVGFFPADDVGDDDLAVLGTLRNLDFVELVQVPITDRGLRHLDGLHRLKYLNLRDSPITDAGLPQLAKLTTLARLNVTGTNITEEGVANLVDALPDCVVVSEYGPQRE